MCNTRSNSLFSKTYLESPLISHVFIGVNDFDNAFDFYSGVMTELDLQLKFCDPTKPWAAWSSRSAPRPLFIIGRPYNGAPADAGNGPMVALIAASEAMVDRVYVRALALGATCEGPPGLRPEYHEGYYGAYFRDEEGNKLCVCLHDAKSS
jgi:catechol 2,3-dioxygenase-like lactoylglutathione lyase family enzyme